MTLTRISFIALVALGALSLSCSAMEPRVLSGIENHSHEAVQIVIMPYTDPDDGHFPAAYCIKVKGQMISVPPGEFFQLDNPLVIYNGEHSSLLVIVGSTVADYTEPGLRGLSPQTRLCITKNCKVRWIPTTKEELRSSPFEKGDDLEKN